MKIWQSLLFLVNRFNGCRVYNISDLMNPTFVNSLTYGDSYYYDIFFYENNDDVKIVLSTRDYLIEYNYSSILSPEGKIVYSFDNHYPYRFCINRDCIVGYSSSYLYYINMRYEYLPHKSVVYAHKLTELYPHNQFYLALLVENLLFIREFNQCDALIDQILCSDNPHHQYIGTVYKGLYYELNNIDSVDVKGLYFNALTIADEKGVGTPHYQSICYLGLGRLYMKVESYDEAKSYLKMAEKTSEYGFIRDEAKELLKSL